MAIPKTSKERLEVMAKAKADAKAGKTPRSDYWERAGICATYERKWNTAASFFERAREAAPDPETKRRFAHMTNYCKERGL